MHLLKGVRTAAYQCLVLMTCHRVRRRVEEIPRKGDFSLLLRAPA